MEQERLPGELENPAGLPGPLQAYTEGVLLEGCLNTSWAVVGARSVNFWG